MKTNLNKKFTKKNLHKKFKKKLKKIFIYRKKNLLQEKKYNIITT